MRRFIPALALAGLTLTACGSTVSIGAQSDSSGLGASGDLSGSLTPGGETTGTSGGTDTAGALTPGTGDSASPTDAPDAGAGGTDTGSVSTPTAVALPTDYLSRPATLSAVEVGIVYVPDANAFAASLGGDGDTGDQKAFAQVAVSWVNAHGGLAGHKITPVFFAGQATSPQPYAQTASQICASFTQDHHVVAAMLVGINLPNELPACLSQKKVLFVTGAHYAHDTKDFQTYPYMVAAPEAAIDDVARKLVPFMTGKSVLKRGDKVGVMYTDYTASKRAYAVFESAAKAAGIVPVGFQIHWPDSTPDIANSLTAVQSAELQMKAQGIKVVTSLCPGCIAFFLKNAESQKYYPRYVVTSFDTPGQVYKSSSGKQLTGTIGFGWNPMQDVDSYHTPAYFAGNATRDQCKQIDRPTGQVKDDISMYVGQILCSGLLLMRSAAAKVAGSTVSGTTLLNGVNQLGTSFIDASTLSTHLSATRHYGASSYRSFHFDYNCSCMKYDSLKLFSLP